MAIDASNAVTRVQGYGIHGIPWAVNASEADASSAVEVKAAPGSGHALCLTYVAITCNDADAYPSLLDASSTLLGPFYSSDKGIVVILDLRKTPIILTANQALNLKGAAAGNISVYVEGYTVLT